MLKQEKNKQLENNIPQQPIRNIAQQLMDNFMKVNMIQENPFEEQLITKTNKV